MIATTSLYVFGCPGTDPTRQVRRGGWLLRPRD